MKLIVGLGNPGKKYEKTRHNVGFMVLDELQKKLSEYQISSWEMNKKFNAQISGCTIKGQKIILVKPQTYMNDSGMSVGQIGQFYKIPSSDLIVVHDEKDLKLGDIKIQTDRGHAGHNGVKSIIEQVSTQNFTRIRVGIASDNEKKMEDTAKFVLHKFGLFEKGKVKESIDRAVQDLMGLIG